MGQQPLRDLVVKLEQISFCNAVAWIVKLIQIGKLQLLLVNLDDNFFSLQVKPAVHIWRRTFTSRLSLCNGGLSLCGRRFRPFRTGLRRSRFARGRFANYIFRRLIVPQAKKHRSRSMFSRVHSWNRISATSSGLTHVTSFIFGFGENGHRSVISGASFRAIAASPFASNPVPTCPVCRSFPPSCTPKTSEAKCSRLPSVNPPFTNSAGSEPYLQPSLSIVPLDRCSPRLWRRSPDFPHFLLTAANISPAGTSKLCEKRTRSFHLTVRSRSCLRCSSGTPRKS